MATNTSTTTANYGLSQYGASDTVKFLTNYNSDMAAIDAAIKAAKDQANAAVPQTRIVAGKALSADIALADLIAAGLCAAPESGAWTPTVYGATTVGTPTYSVAPSGWWYKIGKLVIISMLFVMSSKGGMTGAVMIGGLPFSAKPYGALCIHWTHSPVLYVNGTTVYTEVDASAWSDTEPMYSSTGIYVAQ